MENKKLFIFGDESSIPWTLPVSNKSYPYTYRKWYRDKYNKYPTHFSDTIASHFNINSKNIINKSDFGVCNYTILETIGDTISDINENDIVLIGWTTVLRYREFHTNNQHQHDWSVHNKYRSYNLDDINEKKEVPHRYVSIDRDHPRVYDEITNWQNILKISLPKNTVFWSPFYISNEMFDDKDKIHFSILQKYLPNILKETNKVVNEPHFGNNAHTYIGEWLLDIILNPLTSIGSINKKKEIIKNTII